MIRFTEYWVKSQMDGLWEEMCGLRPVLPARVLGQAPPTTAATDVDISYAAEWIPFSDLNAARLVRLRLDNVMTYTGNDNQGKWYFWNGVFHEEIHSGRIAEMVAEAFADQVTHAMDAVKQHFESRALAAEAQGNTQAANTIRDAYKKGWKPYIGYENRIHNDSGLRALKNRIRIQCAKEPTFFDDDRRWLVCQNGVIDLEEFRTTLKVRLLPHSPERPVTRALSCDFNRDATAPQWEHFLETSLPDVELREFLQRLVGAAFLGESKVKAIANLQGPKDCGKSVFVTTLTDLAQGYGVQPSPTALTKENGVNYEQEKLRGKRFVGVSEPSIGSKLDDTFCKQVTGGDIVNTRTLYQAGSGWVAQCVMFIASNHTVQLNTRDQAFLERLCFIKFPHQFFDASEADEFEPHIKDPDLERKLKEEHEGILQWVTYGMYYFLTRGVDKPTSVKKAGLKVAEESSSALSWVAEKVSEGYLEVAENVSDYPLSAYALLGNLYRMYQGDMEADGERKYLGKHAFSAHLQSMYGDTVDANGRRIPKLVGVGVWENLRQSSGVQRF